MDDFAGSHGHNNWRSSSKNECRGEHRIILRDPAPQWSGCGW
ncbi:hypothetical protein PCL1606_56490 [Pseudomonas chlororaphis]|uniref:Uncharacterized protein n=1 Tax=Pseudomonas chlororaphis TaxID=587753 RepID=A0A0D5Y6X9_9PSED|nr:hypothetical protein PCL1606_56490 [Pseudomonas chlororaphis]